MKKILLSTLVAAGMATSAMAGDVMGGPTDKNPASYLPEAPTSLYNAKEYQLDFYGTYSFADPLGPDDWGGGGAVNYFFTENFGLGVEGMLYDTPGDLAASAAINAFVRMPIGETGIAIYGLAGAGIIYNIEDLDYDDFSDAFDRFFDGDKARAGDDVLIEFHVGGGVEFRCTSSVGVFVDGRYTWTDLDGADFTTVRAGVRITF